MYIYIYIYLSCQRKYYTHVTNKEQVKEMSLFLLMQEQLILDNDEFLEESFFTWRHFNF